MDHSVFPDLNHFVTAWYEAQASFTQMQAEILHASFHDRQPLTEIAQPYRITKQYVHQICDTGLKRLLREARKDPQNPVLTALANAAKIVDMAAIELALLPRRMPPAHETTVIQQLTNIGAISLDQTPWALAILDALPKPPTRRPSLRRLTHDARQVAGQHHNGITPPHLLDHLAHWHDAMTAWPNFDLALHIKAMTGITTDPATDAYHPVIGWKIKLNSDPIFATHYMVRALQQAQRCLTIDDITTSANQIAQRDGADHHYSKAQITQKVQKSQKFKWVGPSTFGLSSWDVGHSDTSNRDGIRLSVKDEVFHLLRNSHGPLPIEDIRAHISKRFLVTNGATELALQRAARQGALVIHPDSTVSLTEPG